MDRGFREGENSSPQKSLFRSSKENKGDFTSSEALYTTPDRQRRQLEQQKFLRELSPLDNIKTLDELLKLISSEQSREVVRAAYDRALDAASKAENKERMKPEALVAFVNKHYNVTPNRKGEYIEYEFTSKDYPEYNAAHIDINPNKGIIRSAIANRAIKKDPIYFSDLQRYACITDNLEEISINEYYSNVVDNSNTVKIANALYYANTQLDRNRTPNGTLKLARGSAAFTVFLGTQVNLSKIFFARGSGRNILGVTIQDANKDLIEFQLRFAPDK